MKTACLAAMAALAMGGAARAEVVSAWDSGFRIENKAVATGTSPDDAWLALGEIGRWWNSSHTYSGSNSNLTIEMVPGGCWCEALPGGGVAHGRVVLVQPETRTLRIDGALGPLQEEGVSAALTWRIAEVDGGVEIIQTYHVGGVRPEMMKNAELIDQVLAEQVEGLRAYLQAAVP